MKRILVISDSHGRYKNMKKAVDKVGKVDAIFHLGDIIMDSDYLKAIGPDNTFIVLGNNDYSSDAPEIDVIEIAGIRFFLTHGHIFGVYYGLNRLADKTRELGCQVALYGHTHEAKLTYIDDIVLFNPGSLAYPRGESSYTSYGIIEIDEDNNKKLSDRLHFTISSL